MGDTRQELAIQIQRRLFLDVPDGTAVILDAVQEKSRFVDSDALPWRESPYRGVSWKKLYYNLETGQSAVLLRFEPGSSYGAHRHPKGEQYLVLEGSLEDGGRSYGAGTYVHHPEGSVHRPMSRHGCLVFVTLPRPIEDLDTPPE